MTMKRGWEGAWTLDAGSLGRFEISLFSCSDFLSIMACTCLITQLLNVNLEIRKNLSSNYKTNDELTKYLDSTVVRCICLIITVHGFNSRSIIMKQN